ncbi:MAG: hypothetical protein WD358_03410 [Nitriliruptoraceae bacterium]
MMSSQHPEIGICPICGYRMLPILDLMPCGHSGEVERQPLEEQGRVYSWTRSWSSPDDSRLIVMADFFDGQLRVTGPLDGDSDVAIGDAVWAHVGSDSPFVLSTSR